MLVPVWFTSLVAGLISMGAMVFTPPKIDFVLKRISAAFFFTSGSHLAIGPGMIGDLFRAISGWLTNLLDGSVAALLGVSIVAGLIALAWATFWLLAMVPAKWVSFEFDDKMIYSGMPLPFFIALIPGEAGSAIQAVTAAINDLTTSLLTGVL